MDEQTIPIPVSQLRKWMELLESYWFSGDRNNDGVIEVSAAIEGLLRDSAGARNGDG